MKKLLISIFLLLILAACSQQYVCPDGSVVDNPDECPPAEEPEAQEEPEPQATPEAPEQEDTIEEQDDVPEDIDDSMGLDKEVQDMMTDAYKRVDGYSFLYVGPPDALPQDIYYVRGKQVYIKVMKDTHHKLTQPYTHVLLDLQAKTATAYCEATMPGRCEEGFREVGEVPYEEFNVKLPMQWIDGIEGAEFLGNGPKFENRGTKKIRFESGNVSGTMHLVDFYFLPAKVILDDGTLYEYRDLKINTVEEKDVTPNI